MLIGGKTCRSCEHRHTQGSTVFCRRYPPQVMIVPVKDERGIATFGFQSAYPAVDPTMPCGEYRRSDLFAREEVEASAAATNGMMRQ